jgi:hypothetical protein
VERRGPPDFAIDQLNKPSSCSLTGQREAQGSSWVSLRCRFHEKAARMTRAAQNSSWLQDESETNAAAWIADEAVVS